MKKFFAFTLAEVLITLGIIGVVAALTIPTLISNHRKKVYVTQLKKAVNTLTNAYGLMLADTEVDSIHHTDFYLATYDGTGSQDIEKLNSLSKKYFNLAKDVEWLSSYSRQYKYIKKSNVDSFPHGPTCVLLTTVDGADICVNGAYAEIDVNGYNRLPNTIGLDYFMISLNDNGKLSSSSLRSGDLPTLADKCLENTQGEALAYCTSSVIKNNWEITYY